MPLINRVLKSYKRENPRKPDNDKETKKESDEKKSARLGESLAEADDLPDPRATTRKTSVAKVVGKILYNPNRKDTNVKKGEGHSVGGRGASLEDNPRREPASTPLTPGKGSTHNQFRRGLGTENRVLQLSADSLLSIVSEMCLYYSRRGVAGSVAAARKFSHQSSRKISVACPPASTMSSATCRVSLDPATVSVSVCVCECACVCLHVYVAVTGRK